MRPFLAALLAAPAAAAWKPAQPTLGVMNIYAAARLPPQPTSAPKLSDLRLAKRADADQTCGYIDGDSGACFPPLWTPLPPSLPGP